MSSSLLALAATLAVARHRGSHVIAKVIIDKKPSEYLSAFRFDIIAHSKPALNYLVQTFGPEQVYFGTDYPFDMGPPGVSAGPSVGAGEVGRTPEARDRAGEPGQ